MAGNGYDVKTKTISTPLHYIHSLSPFQSLTVNYHNYISCSKYLA